VTQERKRKIEVAEGRYARALPPVPTLADFAEEFLAWYAMGRRWNSVRQCRRLIRRWVSWHGQRRLDTFGARVIEQVRVQLLARGLSVSYANAHVAMLGQLLRTAAGWKLLAKDAVPTVPKIRRESPKDRTVTVDEERRLLLALSPRLRPVIRFALHTGLRHEELLQAVWREIAWDRGVIRVPGTRAKNHKDREIPLNETALGVLRGLPGGGPDDRIFGYRAIHTMFVRARRRAGLPEDLKIHTLRHTFATRVLMCGVDPRTLQQWLGHASLEETQKYTHPPADHEQRAIRLLDAPHQIPLSLWGDAADVAQV
jgi:integrase